MTCEDTSDYADKTLIIVALELSPIYPVRLAYGTGDGR